ncbi:MAG: transporter [Verrucomicrobiota bacterium]
MKNFIRLSAILITMNSITGWSHVSDLETVGEPVSRPDAHAPISIMGDHTHKQGEWMLAYRYMYMEMDGMRNNNSSVSFADVATAGFAVTPTDMTHEMQMFGIMYAPTDDLTLMVMTSYQQLEMDHEIVRPLGPLIAANNGSTTFRTRSEGIGDTRVSALYDLYEADGMKLHAGLGLSLPTGSITEMDERPVPFQPLVERILPAAMQLGSGSVEIRPSLTWTHFFPNVSYGVQMRGVSRLHENHEGYQLGDEFATDVWGSLRLSDWMSFSAGLGYIWVDHLEGAQDSVGQNTPVPGVQTIPTAFGENYGYQEVNAIFGVNFLVPHGWFRNHRLAVDARLPVYRNHNGFRLENDFTVTAGWQWAF